MGKELVTKPQERLRERITLNMITFSLISNQFWFNPLSPDSDQQQFSPNDIHTLS